MLLIRLCFSFICFCFIFSFFFRLVLLLRWGGWLTTLVLLSSTAPGSLPVMVDHDGGSVVSVMFTGALIAYLSGEYGFVGPAVSSLLTRCVHVANCATKTKRPWRDGLLHRTRAVN